MNQEIPLSVPIVEGNEWKYIKECLDTGWVSSGGNYVSRFEQLVSEYIGAKYAIATVNGTCALHLALIACSIGRGDEVIVPTLTFIAPVNAVRYCEAEPVFMDCDSQTLCINTEKTIEFLKHNAVQKNDGFTYNKNTSRRIKAIIPVHMFGHPVDLDPLIEVCRKANIEIIEDAAESLGSEYKTKKTASFGRLGCLSFNGNKIITTGGGGMVVTDNEILANKIRHLSTQARIDVLEYDHDQVGYNYRLTNIQAAMGVAQMEKLEEFISIKRNNALRYKELLSEIKEVEFLWEKPWARSNFWFYTIRVPKEHKKSLIKYLLSKKIQVRPVWKLIHTLPMYNYCQAYAIEYAPEVYQSCINLPCSTNLKSEMIEFITANIKDYFRHRVL